MDNLFLHAFSGFSFIWQGLKLSMQKGLRPFVILPLLINFTIFLGLFIIGLHYIGNFSEWIVSLLPHWLAWLSNLVWLFLMISGFLIAAYNFTLIATLLAAPFNALLAAKVQQRASRGHLTLPSSSTNFLKEIAPTMRREWEKLAYYLPRAFLLMLLFFIPVLNIVAPLIWFIFNSWMLSLQYVDYNYENNQLSFNAGRQHLGKHRWRALGFGASITLLTLVPIVNFFVMPAAVAGGTLFWLSCTKPAL